MEARLILSVPPTAKQRCLSSNEELLKKGLASPAAGI